MAITAQRRVLNDKMAAFVDAWFNGDYRAAFDDYDADRDGVLSRDELKRLLVDAQIGTGLTRWRWANGVIAELDRDHDGRISWDEFRALHPDPTVAAWPGRTDAPARREQSRRFDLPKSPGA
jgi:hypothetical protein